MGLHWFCRMSRQILPIDRSRNRKKRGKQVVLSIECVVRLCMEGEFLGVLPSLYTFG